MKENSNKGFIFKKIDSVNIAIAYLLVRSGLSELFTVVLGISSTASSLVINFFWIILLINSLPSMRRLPKKIVFLIIFLLISLTYSFGIGENLDVNQSVMLVIFRTCLWGLILGSKIQDENDLLNRLTIVALFKLIVSALEVWKNAGAYAYSQDIGYEVLLPFIVFLCLFIVKNRWWYLLGSIMAIAVAIMSGARGPLLAIIVGWLIAMLVNANRKSIIPMIVIAILLIIALINFYSIIGWLSNAFSNYGISTRVVSLLENGSLAEDEGRSRIWSLAINYAFNNPICGTGIINDRTYIYNNIPHGRTSTIGGSYCHDIFLELLVEFGLFPGLILCVLLVYLIIRSIKITDSVVNKQLIVIFLVIGMFPLLVSKSYLQFAEFFAMLGYLINVNNRNDKEVGDIYYTTGKEHI